MLSNRLSKAGKSYLQRGFPQRTFHPLLPVKGAESHVGFQRGERSWEWLRQASCFPVWILEQQVIPTLKCP